MIDSFFNIARWGYCLAASLLAIVIIFLIYYFIKKDKNSIIDTLSWKYAIILFCVSIICAPLDYYWSTANLIPEKNYTITTKLTIVGEENPYSVDAMISYYKDFYYDEYNPERTKVYVWDEYMLISYDFNGYVIEELPEKIESNGKYSVQIWMPTDMDGNSVNDEDYSPRNATIQFPAITKENLGITPKDTLEAYGNANTIAHMVVFAFGLIGIIVWLLLRSKRDAYKSTIRS